MKDFPAPKTPSENKIVGDLLRQFQAFDLNHNSIAQQARVLIETIRQRHADTGGFSALMQSYNLTSEEGLALMTLAEALLRIPDVQTANDLIHDKLSEGDWNTLFAQATDITGRLSGFGLSLSQRVLDSLIGKIGMPFIRKACVEAMQMMGRTFVLGRTIDEAITNAKKGIDKGYLYNFDMLGEGARTSVDAANYFKSYESAIHAIGKMAEGGKDAPIHQRPGISVKLTALYPRYEFAQAEKAIPYLSEKLKALCILARDYHLNLTVDAEECERLLPSLEIIKAIFEDPAFAQWEGFGFAVQAYHKRTIAVIETVLGWTKRHQKKMTIRLVKGAYWDTEIKHAQVEGHDGYPVYTRKENTDLSYLVCAKMLLDNRDHIIPMLGTHNAHTVASIMAMVGKDREGFTFQRLHGMGEQLYDQLLADDFTVCVYAPVGSHKDLLAYLVRRLLENGANSSFVNKVYDANTPVDDLIISPLEKVLGHEGHHTHPKIPLPAKIYSDRANSKGIDITEPGEIKKIDAAIAHYADLPYHAPTLIAGKARKEGLHMANINPSNKHDMIGDVWHATDGDIETAFAAAQKDRTWRNTLYEDRAATLETIADLYETNMNEIIALLTREAGKTLWDAVAEIREAVDFCRYYALQARKLFAPQVLQGPTGEENTLLMEGRGTFVCISPWNFPLAIFTGQIVAALVAGNNVIAKPAEQTPAIATYAVELMYKAGVPHAALSLLQGDGDIGAKIIKHHHVDGVAFTGSTAAAKAIQRTLAAKDGPIVPLIAETGGLNAMIVDSSALPEQVTDDVLNSAFGTAGQRCSALRILCVQDDVANTMISMIKGAMEHLVVGDPAYLSTDVGPIIDQEALANLVDYQSSMAPIAMGITSTPYDHRLDDYGTFLAPTLIELPDIDHIHTEAFGPILHVVRYKESELPSLINKINAKGFGLTFGLHTRIEHKQEQISKAINAGNIYINRGQTGAVVGVQPFGGRGLSGTGPKAGGPHYLLAFATEKAISNNVTACGGNTTLVNL